MILLLSGVLFSCVSVPNINVCKEKTPTRARCTKTLTGEGVEINDAVKLHDKTWWENRVTNVQIPFEDYKELKAFILKMCEKYPDACKQNNTDQVLSTIDGFVAPESTPVEIKPTESKPYPAQGWDARYDDLIKKELEDKSIMDSVPSRMNFCPKWAGLSKDARVREFSLWLRAITVFESGIKLNSRMVETTMGTDPITGMQVASEGLFQLSYQDAKNYEGCKGIDFKKDKGLDAKDLKRTIFIPEVQFKCTIYIMDRIMSKRTTENAIGDGSYGLGRYWSVVRTNKKADAIKTKMIEYKSNCF